MEKAHWQFVSGWMFSSLGIRPALGRVLTENDDLKPGSSPVAVLTYDYWSSRFAGDPKVIGRTFRAGNDLYEIVGVSAKGFTGTETGTAIDILVPTMMEAGSINSANSFWIRTFVRPRPGAAIELLRQKLFATYQAHEQEREKGFTNFPQSLLEASRTRMLLKSAAEGVSEMQKDYQRSLLALGVLVMLVLLIACANVANLMAAQAAARAREMALRVSIGAGRWRLVQLVLVESAFLAFLAAAIGMLFAWWSAPLVVRMINPPDNPAHLVLPADWRVIGFGLLLTLAVTLLFGLAPALRASGVKPISALKGEDDVRMRRPLMHALIAVRVAFCFLVLFVGGLFIATFQRLANLPAGFTAEGLLTLDTVAKSRQPTLLWNQVAQHLRTVPGVDSVALAAWPLMSGTMSNNFISINGAPPSDVLAFFLKVSPGWLDTMKILLIDGRDFRSADIDPSVAIVNQTFVKQYFSGQNPIGKSFELTYPAHTRLVIVGIAKDAGYRSVREPMLPVFYIPIESAGPRGDATILVRTSRPDPLLLATALRREVSRAHPEFRVSNIRTQVEINQAQTIRERLLAMLALFFAAVALLLAGVGLYGVLDYSVLQRRREIGIRMAIGARPAGVARLVTVDVFAMVLVGAIGGLALGMASVRYIEPLFYDVKPTDLGVLAIPSLTIIAAALLAAVPAVLHAIRIDPVEMLRSK
jgi:predicted permease